MEVTRQFWTVAAVGVFLAVWGVIVAAPLALLGSAAVGAWLLARQYRFVRAVASAPMTITVALSTRDRVTAEETAQLSIQADLERTLPVTIDVAVRPPVGASGESATATILPGEDGALAHTTLNWPVAGSFTVDEIEATVTDGRGLFRQTFDLAGEQPVQVTPRAPVDLHMGEGGEPITTGLGHSESRLGTGIEPAEVREYVPGDAVRQIDWKATARLDQPHVQEFEGGTDRETLLFFDHRDSMADGRPGTRKLDYARQLAVAFIDGVQDAGDGFGYYAVGDEGITTAISPTVSTDALIPARDHLLAVSPTTARADPGDPTRSKAGRTAAGRLATDESTFGRTLVPFLEAHEPYRRRFDSLPLYRAVTTADYSSTAVVRTIIVTDDTNRAELREAVTYARSRGGRVTVFLTPTVLFDTAEMTDLDRAYDDYVDFEEFRRELAGIGRVDAFEVGPGDRLSAVLSAGRERRTRENA